MVCFSEPHQTSQTISLLHLDFVSDSVFPMFFKKQKNGTAECTAEDAFKHAGENIVFGSGSPFDNVDLGIFLFSNVFLLWIVLAPCN